MHLSDFFPRMYCTVNAGQQKKDSKELGVDTAPKDPTSRILIRKDS